MSMSMKKMDIQKAMRALKLKVAPHTAVACFSVALFLSVGGLIYSCIQTSGLAIAGTTLLTAGSVLLVLSSTLQKSLGMRARVLMAVVAFGVASIGIAFTIAGAAVKGAEDKEKNKKKNNPDANALLKAGSSASEDAKEVVLAILKGILYALVFIAMGTAGMAGMALLPN